MALIGTPDDRWGEIPHAVISVHDGQAVPNDDELIAWTRERLAGYKCPKVVTVVDALPRNTTGTIQENLLRTLAVAR